MPWEHLRVPASSANLGPGFDALGLALDIHLECRFRSADRLSIQISGDDAGEIPAGETNLIWRTAQRIAELQGRALTPVELQIHNSIPLGKGLGSSAAALTAGVVMADQLLALQWSRDRILKEAARLEGHPDNVSACVLGGIAVSALDEDGEACAIRLELPPQCELAIAIPDYVLPTSQSRAVLPSSYSREDLVFNLQRTGLLVAALATGRMESFRTALADRIHQPFRALLVPGLVELLALQAPGLYGCVLSGAGPSVLFFLKRGDADAFPCIDKIVAARLPGARVKRVSICLTGYQIRTEASPA